jgi:hypothetical protein
VPPASRNLLIVGDSLSVDANYPTDLMAMMPVGTTHTTVALPGAGAQTIYVAASPVIATAVWTDIIILAGINDIGVGVSAIATYPWMHRMYEEANAVGARLTGIELLPWGNGGTWNAARQVQTELFDTYLNSELTPWRVVDTSPMATGNALSAIYDSGDGVHPNAAGYQKLADLVYAALQ